MILYRGQPDLQVMILITATENEKEKVDIVK